MPGGQYYAHSFKDRSKDHWETLEDHLRAVACLCREFAAFFASEGAGWLAGLWHDLGKYHEDFVALLEGESIRFDHAVYGAQLVRLRIPANPYLVHALSAIIAGHHGGLRDHPKLTARFLERGKDLDALLEIVPGEIQDCELPELPPFLRERPQAKTPKGQRDFWIRRLEFWTRFLFSALVDADSLATEKFYHQGMRSDVLGPAVPLGELQADLDLFLEAKGSVARPSEVQRLRIEILGACRSRAADPPGFFSLTVPTGGGKTFSSLAFALKHAAVHGLRRVISVIPFTSILEQTAGQYALAIGGENLIEHHSGLDPEVETRKNLLASENWDSPVVVTTAVQFFESLYASRRSPCRKLHNIARSVIVLDEAQTLPVQYLTPVLDALRTLVSDYGCSVLFSTATQPALARSAYLPEGIEGVREIVAEPAALARSFRRYNVAWPGPAAPPVTWEELAADIAKRPQALVILHLRRDARELAGLLPAGEGLFHLSANLCAAHRSQVISEVKSRLQQGLPCRLISTQVVEAGVDIDFPVVYRAFAGLDSLVQSGGRCNREGLLAAPGELIVFRAPTQPPPGILRHGVEKMELLLADLGKGLDITDPDIVARYFRLLYRDAVRDAKSIQAHRAELAFDTVAKSFRLIEDDWQVGIAVPWGEGESRIERLRREGPSRATFRALQPYLVNIAKRVAQQALNDGLLEEVEGVLCLPGANSYLYHSALGLTVVPFLAEH